MSDVWFHLPELTSAAGGSAELGGDEARHAAGAKRMQVGDVLHVFDGRGQIAEATVTSLDSRKRGVIIAVGAVTTVAPPAPDVHVAAALPKGDRQSVMLSMLSQLGMSRFTPLRCARSVATAGRNFAERAARICTEACKQSRNPFIPEITAEMTPGEFAAGDRRVVLAHPGGVAAGEILARLAGETSEFVLLIGPEGGFCDAEANTLLDAGAVAASLGPTILRIETAAVALLALIRLR